MKPLAIDLFAGLGGWSEGLIDAGFRVVGFDVERHRYLLPKRNDEEGKGGNWCGGKQSPASWAARFFRELGGTTGWREYPGQLVLQDVRTIHGAQFKDAALVVASPPCTEFSYMAMPWKRAKRIAAALRGEGDFPDGYRGSRTRAELTALFDACFRIRREAEEASGRKIPLVVENVRGAQPWVGRAEWAYGSYYLWGDVPALMPITARRKVPGFRFDGSGRSFQTAAVEGTKANPDGTSHPPGSWFKIADSKVRGSSIKNGGGSWFNVAPGETGRNPVHRASSSDTFGWSKESPLRNNNSRSPRRKAASALIAKIPYRLARWIGDVFRASCAEAKELK